MALLLLKFFAQLFREKAAECGYARYYDVVQRVEHARYREGAQRDEKHRDGCPFKSVGNLGYALAQSDICICVYYVGHDISTEGPERYFR